VPSEARFDSVGDPNDWRVVAEGSVGARYTPLTSRDHQRIGARGWLKTASSGPRC
jgi:hypothetical protein